LPPLALKPTELTDDQRRCLQLLKSVQIKVISVAVSALSFGVLWQLYKKLPQVAPVLTPTAGVIVAIASFFFACLFLQISVSAGRSLLVDADTLQRVKPVKKDAIAADFLILGLLHVRKLLPLPPAEAETVTKKASPQASSIEASFTEASFTEVLPIEAPAKQKQSDDIPSTTIGSEQEQAVVISEDTDLLLE